jgi:hypothetical protein
VEFADSVVSGGVSVVSVGTVVGSVAEAHPLSGQQHCGGNGRGGEGRP